MGRWASKQQEERAHRGFEERGLPLILDDPRKAVLLALVVLCGHDQGVEFGFFFFRVRRKLGFF